MVIRYVNVYLNPYKRKEYIGIFEVLKEKYAKMDELLFNDIEKETEEFQQRLEEEVNSSLGYDEVDISDLYEATLEKVNEHYKYEQLMKYNFHLSLLTTGYQIFEQQLRQLIYRELNHIANPIRTIENFSEFGSNMREIKAAYKFMDFDLEEVEQWNGIQILSDIINTYKHGEGRSAKRLLKSKPEYFLKDEFLSGNYMSVYLTTNSEIVFDIHKIGFNNHINNLIAFWREFPQHINKLVEVEE